MSLFKKESIQPPKTRPYVPGSEPVEQKEKQYKRAEIWYDEEGNLYMQPINSDKFIPLNLSLDATGHYIVFAKQDK